MPDQIKMIHSFNKSILIAIGLTFLFPGANAAVGNVRFNGPANGVADEKKPVYKDPEASVDNRIQDLLKRMTREEKVGQLSVPLGWEMYDKKGKIITVSGQFRKEIQDRHIGMLWAALRADPWTKKTLETGLNPYLAALTTNALQKYAVENSRLGIPLLLAEECPHGHMAIGTTVFPSSIGQSSTWNPELIEEMSAVIAKEARLQGAHIGYGPVLDLAREPRWSRVEETYGEDPFLNSRMGVAMVQGFQGKDLKSGINLSSTLKHFAAYGVPEGGQNGGFVNTGSRELQESFLPPFRAAVTAGAWSVMASYNAIDGIPCSSDSYLLNDILRKQWNFKGFVVSDLGSIEGLYHTHRTASSPSAAAAQAINAGLDADLGAQGFDKALLSALQKGLVSETVLDKAVERVLRMKFEMGLFENPYVDPDRAGHETGSQKHRALALQVARESIILLKNEKGILPLSRALKHIAVIGPNADNIYNQLGDYTAPQADSSIVTVLKGIRQAVGKTTRISYVKGCSIRDTSSNNIGAAVTIAKDADVTVVVLGGSSARDFKTNYINTGAASVSGTPDGAVSDMESGEGFDRTSLDLMGHQLRLLQQLVATGKPIILVMIQGRPLNLNWAADNVPAILNAWYPGEEGGHAIADVLFGDYNPAGRLPVSVPRSVGQLPVYYNYKKPLKHDYVESKAGALYNFGYGLSYSKFEYSNMHVKSSEKNGMINVDITFTLKNLSSVEGDEVAQLYLTDDFSSVVTPVKQLKGFKRIHLKAGEERELHFHLNGDDLKLLSPEMEWTVEPGSFTVALGASSDDIRLNGKFEIINGMSF